MIRFKWSHQHPNKHLVKRTSKEIRHDSVPKLLTIVNNRFALL
jgi:hypothetical protein